MALADDVMDHPSLLHNEADEHDFLNEFLDQRVYDSLAPNTPAHPQDEESLDMLHNEVFRNEMFRKLKATPDGHLPDHLEDFGANYEALGPVPDSFTGQNSTRSLSNDLHLSRNGSSSESLLKMQHQNDDYLSLSPRHASFSLENSPKNVGSQAEGKPSVLKEHELIRKEFNKVKFGNSYMNPCPPTLDIEDPSVLDFSPETLASLPYQLQVMNLPSYSRVETQIKLSFQFSPAPKEALLHIPQDLVSKSKFCLKDPVESLPETVRKNMLYLDSYVLTSNLRKSCGICTRCIKREQKRAMRSKGGAADSSATESPTSSGAALANGPDLWADESMNKKAIFFNCKEIISFPPPSGLMNDHYKSLDFSARIICYCRHHKELQGFKLLFVVRDYNNEIVAKHLSDPIMIMDRKKTTSGSQKGTSMSAGAGSQSNQDFNDTDSKLHPLSPNSMDDSNSEAFINTDTNNESTAVSRGYKRKKLSFDDSYNAATNPMFNGSGFSPLSNSDTNASLHNISSKTNLAGSAFPSQAYPNSHLIRQRSSQQLQQVIQADPSPVIQKIIPAQGPIRGGVEITLLGYNFHAGLTVKFGSKNALATHCWSDSSIVTYLPPAAHPGQVLVSFEDCNQVMVGGSQSIFTYTDDTDRQLIELALQIVGLKMNGKLEDAKNIAQRIVGSDAGDRATQTPSPHSSPPVKQENMEWNDIAHKAVEKLSRSDLSTEDILINFLALVDLPNCPIIIPNWQLSNNQGQTLLHLATLKKYSKLIGFLITHGCKIDIKDNQGLTPLFFASMCGYRELINVFIDCKANWNLRLDNDKTLIDYSDLNVLDMFNRLEENSWSEHIEPSSSHASSSEGHEETFPRANSVDSLNSMFMMNYGKHVSRMVMESNAIGRNDDEETVEGSSKAQRSSRKHRAVYAHGNESSDFADSELDTEDEESGWGRKVDEADYYDEDSEAYESTDAEQETDAPKKAAKKGLWQMMKTAVFSNDTDTQLPSYNDLFPFGNGFMRPKTQLERELNEDAAEETKVHQTQEDAGIASDSSEDIVISYINHPRKTVQNDKMLLFFWLPVLCLILGLFVYSSVTGYKLEMVEGWKDTVRNAIGNVVVGNERLTQVFNSKIAA